MRLIQPWLNFFESAVGRSSKMGNIICFIVYAVLNTIMLVIIFVTVYVPTPTGDEYVRDAMAVATVWCLFFELVIWDTIF